MNFNDFKIPIGYCKTYFNAIILYITILKIKEKLNKAETEESETDEDVNVKAKTEKSETDENVNVSNERNLVEEKATQYKEKAKTYHIQECQKRWLIQKPKRK